MPEFDVDEEGIAWDFMADVPVECVAVARSAGWSVAAGGRNVWVIDEHGKARGEFRAGQSIRRLRAGDDGNFFAALAGQGVVYVFDALGGLEWRVEFDGQLADFDIAFDTGWLAAATAFGDLCLYDRGSARKTVGGIGWSAKSISIVQEDPFLFAVADSAGRVALGDWTGRLRWRKELGGQTGPISYDRESELLAVPAAEKGLRLLSSGGEERNRIEFGEPVRRAGMTAGGTRFLLETQSDRMVLVDGNATIRWELELDRAPADWAVDGAGRMIVLAKGGRQLLAHLFEGAEAPAREAPPAPAAEPAAAPPEAALEPLPIEPPPAEPPAIQAPPERVAPSPPAGTGAPEPPAEPPEGLVWRRPLPGGLAPEQVLRLRVADGGEMVVLLADDGTVVLLDAAGEIAAQERVTGPADVAPRMPARAFCVWGEREALLVGSDASRVRRVQFGILARYFDCAADLSLLCAVDEAGRVRAFRGDAPAWSQVVSEGPCAVAVSPGGETAMVADTSQRFCFYDAQGRLFYKFRFDSQQMYEPWGVGNGYSVFSNPTGHVIAVDRRGERLWSGWPLGALTHCRVLGDVVAVYREQGACAVVDPREDRVWEMWPPPGQAYLRKPAGAPAELVHAGGNALTAYTGYHGKLDVLWRFECDDAIVRFDVDLNARAAVALAGSELYRIDAVESP